MRSYGEVVDVRTVPGTGPGPDGQGGTGGSSDMDVPAQFLWRGRVYVVRDVLAHWIELGAWWSARGPAAPGRPGRTPAPGSGRDAAAPARSGPTADAAPRWSVDLDLAGHPAGTGQRSVAADVGAVERLVWRVEAAAGRSATPGVYDLVRDVPAGGAAADREPGAGTGRWRLARALD